MPDYLGIVVLFGGLSILVASLFYVRESILFRRQVENLSFSPLYTQIPSIEAALLRFESSLRKAVESGRLDRSLASEMTDFAHEGLADPDADPLQSLERNAELVQRWKRGDKAGATQQLKKA
jgi:hypothetical protein